jgi:hypothetical protein
MPKVAVKPLPPNSTQSAEFLIEFAELLEKEVLDLRALACEKAAKARAVRELIPLEQVQAVQEQKDANQAWSLNGHGKNIMDLISNGK